MQIIADVGGIPGKDCKGFCKYCYFRKVKKQDPLDVDTALQAQLDVKAVPPVLEK